ncbi:MAG TPA: PEP-CTERM-box response regulator transcription factor [Candidatus Eisenbacteria bacterium]|nr:PEP-CTERM-box response regulator transcription factor [Candidatus Eisenbacteria bacterium]
MNSKLLLVDDDQDICSQMKWALAEDYEILLAHDGPTALEILKSNRPLVVVLDLGLPPHPNSPEEGLNTLSALLAIDPLIKVIVATGQSEKQHALRAIGQGAYDFLGKPVAMEELKFILKRAFHVAHLERECKELQRHTGDDGFEGMLGMSPPMQQVFTSIRKVATTEAPVLILGESGTGKEMAALAIHRKSARKEGPFIAINCGAIPETLLESELFGHEKGSFTGAHMQRKGRIETAAGGTLFLDEVGELPLLLQVKLLRFLQEQTIERVGGRGPIEIDARVIAATNLDLKTAMAGGKFREDLFYRLAVVVIRLPSLRERPADVLLLARSFLQRSIAENKRKSCEFNSQALRALQQYSWPGNVRELENRVRRAVIMAEGRHVTASDLELVGLVEAETPRSLKEAREELERELVSQALQRHGGNITTAAGDLGVSRPTLYELMEKLGIEKAGRIKEE